MTTSPARKLTALSLVAAPAVMGAALLTDITPQTESTRELLAMIAQKPGAWAAGQTLFFLSAVLWLPAGLALIRLLAPSGVLGRVAGAAVAVGGFTVLAVDAANLYLRYLVTSDITLDQQVTLVEAVENSSALIVFEAIHIAGLFLGLLLVGVVMLRHRNLPRWSGVLVLIGTVGLVVPPAGILLALPIMILTLGLGAAAAQASGAGHSELPSPREPQAADV